MSKLHRPSWVALLGILFTAASNYGAVFDFSYEFSAGTKVTGSLTGTPSLDGKFVENVVVVTEFIDGTPISGPIYSLKWDGSQFVDGAVVSFDALDNNFSFDNRATAKFYIVGGGTFLEYPPSLLVSEGLVPAKWSLTAAVPEPAAYSIVGVSALLLLGSRRILAKA